MNLTPFSNLISGNSLLSRCLRGGSILAVGTVFERGFRFVVNMILARLLAPDQFGLMALVMAAIAFFEALTEVGIRQSIVQNKKGGTAEFLNVAWWFSAVRGVALYVVGFLAAPWVARFYGEPALVSLLRVAFLNMLFLGLTNPSLYVLEKRLQFGRYVWIMQGSAAAGTLLCLGLAIWMPSVWALVAGVVAQGFFRCLLAFLFCPIHIGFRFDRVSWQELFRFSRRMIGLPILTYLFMQADILFMGRMLDKDTLGSYSMALALATTPQMLFSKIAGPMLLPVFAQSQDSLPTLRDRLLKMTRMLFLFGLPITTCMAVFSEAILTVVYGPAYSQVFVAFGLLCYYVLFYVAGVLMASLYFSVGRPDIHRWFTLSRVIFMGVILYPAIFWFGSTGAAASRLICLILAGVVQQINLSRLIGLPVLRYVATLNEGAVLSLAILPPALLLRSIVVSPIIQVSLAAGLCGFVWLYILWAKKDSVKNLFCKNASPAPA